MYRGTAAPIFDVPEFPTLRRIKPLPKRRRTTSPDSSSGHQPMATETPTPQHGDPPDRQTPPLPPMDPLIPPEIAEELLSRVDNLSTRAALQNYYIPILGNVQHFLARSHHAHSGDGGGSSNNNNNNTATAAASAAAAALAAIAGAGRHGSLPIPPLADLDSIEFGVHFAAAAAAAAAAGLPMGGPGPLGMGINIQMGPGAGGGDGDERADSPSQLHDDGGYGEEEGSEREDDYAGHVGNAKKRKVPTNLNGSLGNAGEGGSPLSSYLDEDGSDSLPGVDGGADVSLSLKAEEDDPTPPLVFPARSFPGQLSNLIRKKGKLAAARLQHKEQLKARKRQLAAVMGALTHADTLTLDQALSFNYLFGAHTGEALKVRKSKRRRIRLARAMKILMERPDKKNRHPDAIPFPESDFTFKCASSTTDRLISTKEEIAGLRKRFEAELERQAARAAKVALAGSEGDKPSGRAKRERQERERERAARAARQKKAKSNISGEEDQTAELDSLATGLGMEKAKAKSGKKKKRSALANASNPHHLRNYVPSRLPNSGAVDGGDNIWPLPVRFLTAEIPGKGPGSDRKAGGTQAGEEWICAFCEYELFYGDEGVYRKAVRNRKKVLRRRRRAAERAAAAASGGNTTAKTGSGRGDEEHEEMGLNEHGNGNGPPRRSGRWKEAPDKGA